MLFNFDPPATPEEVRAAAVQYVRKVSGATRVSESNRGAFERAIVEVEMATHRLLGNLVAHAPARSREHEAAKARERWRRREERIRAAKS
jgi:hypothetical protein